MRAAEIHARVGSRWHSVLLELGIPEASLRVKKSGPCPACGGRDRFTFDNRKGKGDYICRGCGAGDGFALLMRVHGWNFTETRRRVIEAAALESCQRYEVPLRPAGEAKPSEPARVPNQLRTLLRASCEAADCPDVLGYLKARAVWPLPEGCELRAHMSAPYFEEGKHIGRFSALLAPVRDVAGDLVTVHATYLEHGQKVLHHTPRKILSSLEGRAGCALRLMPLLDDVLGIAEGIESALSAHQLHQVPTWAALNRVLLAKFEPPSEVHTLIVFADRDAPGLEAAGKLMERLQGRVRLELRVPRPPAKDWNDIGRAHQEAA